MNTSLALRISPLLLALAACSPSTDPATQTEAPAGSTDATTTPTETSPADTWMASLAAHCGKAYEGRIASNEPAQPDDAFEGKALIMHVRGCDNPERRIEVPFHVGDDHSRTWILTRTDNGLRLKHDHRQQDGSPDPVTMYGGDTAVAGTATRQEFPVDAESITLFQENGLPASVTNTWAMEVNPNTFVYELARPQDELNPQRRLFRVEFDLTREVEPPPTPWGWD